MNILKFFLALCALFCISTASAVSLSTSKIGQVLIFPYYGVHGGNQTLIQIDSFLTTNALKVHIRNTSGEIVLTFNLYMGEESWAAAIHQVNGQTYLQTNDNSCTTPRLNQTSLGIPLPANSGYIEVLEMGLISNREIIDASMNFDCDVIDNLWQHEGQWTNDPSFGLIAPRGALRGTASLINVGEGTLYSFVATALIDFTDIPQHTPAGSDAPNLISPHGEGSAEGLTHTRICTDKYCFHDDWESPFKALSAVLAVDYSRGEFTINTDIGAKTEVILTYPLLAYSEQQGFRVENEIQLYVGGLAPFDSPPSCITTFIGNPDCNPEFTETVNSSIFTMSFNNDLADLGTEVVSNILGETHTVFFPRHSYRLLPDQSVFRIDHNSNRTPNNPISRRFYLGSAVIGVVLQKYTNGQLLNGQGEVVLANYSNALELSRELRSFAP